MRFLLAITVLVGCSQAQPSGPMGHTQTVGVIDQDSGAAQPVDMVHRLKSGSYLTSDGLLIPAPYLFDTAMNMQCWPAVDDTDHTRCFPNIGYSNRAFQNPGCSVAVAIVEPGTSLVGSVHGSRFRVNRVGALLPPASAYTLNDSDSCVIRSIPPGQGVYELGEDLTPTLETLDLVFP